MWIPRYLEKKIAEVVLSRPAMLLTGIRQAGKSALLKKMYPEALYVTLDRVMTAASSEENPHAFLEQFKEEACVVLDEIQYAPSLFRELKIRIDENRAIYGKWLLTGSQKFSLMKNASESLAGRISILELETLSTHELRQSGYFQELDDILWKGGFPETWAGRNIDTALFFEDYIQTYLEKDLRAILQVTSLRDFQRFIRACAARTGQLLNLTDIAKDIGVSSNTIKSWINSLETSGIIFLLQPYSSNIGKRLVKAPKIFFSDQGLLCSLLNIHSLNDVRGHIYEGRIWENFVFTEILKTAGIRPSKNLFFYRDQNMVEIDFLIELDNKIFLIEAKSAEIVSGSKLNFNKIKNLFRDVKTECFLASRIGENGLLELKDYRIYNPLNYSPEFCS